MNPYEAPYAPRPATSWPYGHGTGQRPQRRSRAGIETRQILLTLGAVCLIVAFTAGTALVWSALGPGGQMALMGAITVALLAGAAAIRRLPATAEALGAVGLAGCVVDAIAARTLHLSAVETLTLHSYVALAAVGVAMVAVTLGLANSRLVSAPLVTSSAALVAAVAAVNPHSLDRAALLTPIGIAVTVGLDHALRQSAGPNLPARVVNAAGGALIAIIGFGASLVAAAQHDPVGMWGAALPLALLALPLLAANAHWVADDATAALSGSSAAAMVMAAGVHTGASVRAAEAVGLPVIAVLMLALTGAGWTRRMQIAVSPLAVPGVLAWLSLVADPRRFAAVDFALAAAAAVVAVWWPRSRAGSAAVRAAATGAGTLLATIAVGITLGLHHVTTPEAYVATPAALGLAFGAGRLIRHRQASSAVLAPGLAVGMLPTLAMALGNDHGRQAALLVTAALVVALSAELRLGTPLVIGAAAIGLLSLRLIGPQLAMMPRWVLFGAVGAALLALGATWEARLDDLRRMSGRLRPRIAALR